MFDQQIGTWHVVDPNADKYSSVAPYFYALANPVLFIDPNGRDPVLYDENGKKVATFKGGKSIL